jgi:acetyl coenzyme A synthetase (ADP forming)-like protein
MAEVVRDGSLDALFRPRSVAVIGASRQRGTIGAEVFHNLIASGFAGPVYPVNPAARSIQSVRAYASVKEIPDELDLAVIVVPKERVQSVVEECSLKGVRGLVVLSAGFAEVGPEGKALQDKLVRTVRRSGMRLVGPNCLGLLNTDPAVRLNATFAPTWPEPGPVAIASQSGAIGVALLDYARELGLGISYFASIGNKADVSGNDLLTYWENDPATRVILLYLESFGNPARFMEIARRVTRKKAILVVKSGRTEAGARAASSHTGALAGADVAVDALLGQAGVLRADTIEELFDIAMFLANQPVPRGRRVAVLTNAGGPGIMAADACESHGLELAELSAATRAGLQAALPPEASLANPVDILASASARTYEEAARLLLADEAVDSLIVLFVPPIVTEASEVAHAIRRSGASASKPILTCLLGTHGIPPAVATLREGRFPSYAFPESAVKALARGIQYGRWLQRPLGRERPLAGIDLARAREALRGIDMPEGESVWLPADAVRQFLDAFGLRMPRTRTAVDLAATQAAASEVGFPVALKLLSRRILHKTEVGGVHLHLRDPNDVERAYAAIRGSLERHRLLDAFEGVIVQEMVERGAEMYVGVTQATGFGALLAFGSGGVAVEVFRDVAFRVHPISDVDAEEMLEQVRGRVLLEGFRGSPRCDKPALVDALLRVDRMLSEFPTILEMDINPLVALAEGEGVVAVDARIRMAAGARASSLGSSLEYQPEPEKVAENDQTATRLQERPSPLSPVD